ncbi:AMP-binding protein [Krasilnikovia sp. MM14-A1004]|uniref:AMP-binding protein n=1 Tax=Krasilnikovia sp. MM14-A1004 TaxID=3373541 RepID=UPI00399CCE01
MDLLAGLSRPEMDAADAIRVGADAMSAERLLGAAAAVAADVRGARVVAVHAAATLHTVVAVVGALLGGAAVVPLPPDSGPAEADHILADSGATLLLTGAAEPPSTTLPVVPVNLSRTGTPGTARTAPGDPALIMYTSGTTGAPKGVVLSHAAVAADLDALAGAWAWTPADVLVHGLPLFHVHGLVLGVLGALRVGCRLHHTGRPRPEAYAAAGGTLYFGVPTVWSRVCADPAVAAALSGARLLVSGSAALPVPVFARLAALSGHRPVERYGMTETLITVSGRADGERRPGHVGLPLAGVRTRIVHDEGHDLPRDGESIGELWVHGPMLFDGYLNRPDATAAARTADGWMRTGDIAAIGPDGWHRIVGRRSTDLIKSGGYRVGAGEVEDALLAHPAVREAAVVGTPHDDLGEQITAYVVADGVGGPELIDFVARTLSAHKRPREVRFVAELPRNAMGKVRKTLLGRG